MQTLPECGNHCCVTAPAGTGKFKFSHPSTQQHLLVWRDRPKVIMVIKKLGRELQQQFMQVGLLLSLSAVYRVKALYQQHISSVPGCSQLSYRAQSGPNAAVITFAYSAAWLMCIASGKASQHNQYQLCA